MSAPCPAPRPPTNGSRLLDGDAPLTEADLAELGLEEVPADAGPSWEEISGAQRGGPGYG
jgi:hypothetical protein